MAALHQSRVDGRYVGVASIDSADAWTDVALSDYESITGEAIPATGVSLVNLLVRNDSASPAYLLLRASDSEAASAAVALEIPAGGAWSADINLSAAVSTISVYGIAEISAILV